MKMAMCIILMLVFAATSVSALENVDKDFKIYQFPRTMLPRIDGDTSDWDIVGEEYVYGTELLNDTSNKNVKYDPEDLDIRVRIGWVKGDNKLYFLYEAYDDVWDFEGPESDIFEIVVDADMSGGPYTTHLHPEAKMLDRNKLYKKFHGVHAQNYHINVPPGGKHWAFVWGGNDWISYFPYANWAYDAPVKQGESGRVVLEFYVTCFDYAPYEGPVRAVESVLDENELIALGWAVLEHEATNGRESHWTLAPNGRMTSDASHFCPFRLMPMEDRFRAPLECGWSFKVVDMNRRLVAFIDESYGTVDTWSWDFDDGTTSDEQHPIHTYEKPGIYNVVLTVSGPDGTAQHQKTEEVVVW
jgi:hypothetical protein